MCVIDFPLLMGGGDHQGLRVLEWIQNLQQQTVKLIIDETAWTLLWCRGLKNLLIKWSRVNCNCCRIKVKQMEIIWTM